MQSRDSIAGISNRQTSPKANPTRWYNKRSALIAPGNGRTKAMCMEEHRAAGLFHLVGSKLNCIIKSSLSISHGISPGALTRVIRAVHTGDRQAIMVTPTKKDIEAAQGLQRLAINNPVLSINGQLREDPGDSKEDVLETMSD